MVDLIDRLVSPGQKEKAKACVVPHAGYIYSGRVAGEVYGRIESAPRCVILGPNHTGQGRPFSLMATGTWITPLGEIPIDEELAQGILKEVPDFQVDFEAHRDEHSVEVQIPFLQHLRLTQRFVPLTFMHTDLATACQLGLRLAQAIRKIQQEVLLIASTDLTHYEPQEEAQRKDRMAIDSILALDEKRLADVVEEQAISMCGVVPTLVTLVAAKVLGATQGRLIQYATSGQASGDTSSVVGYAGVLIR